MPASQPYIQIAEKKGSKYMAKIILNHFKRMKMTHIQEFSYVYMHNYLDVNFTLVKCYFFIGINHKMLHSNNIILSNVTFFFNQYCVQRAFYPRCNVAFLFFLRISTNEM